MSKRMNRIALAVLISLAIVVAVYTSVLGASLHAGASRGAVRTTAGLTLDVSHVRSQGISLNAYYSDVAQPARVHDCSHDSAVNPDD
ncbi:MAG TPA: hypothetical protein VN653_15720 [Anaerolineales bacterium]|nr:hypothetical protein [Anaerolineales bacterium]